MYERKTCIFFYDIGSGQEFNVWSFEFSWRVQVVVVVSSFLLVVSYNIHKYVYAAHIHKARSIYYPSSDVH